MVGVFLELSPLPPRLSCAQVLSLVDENFAAGVRYSIDFTYNETTHILIYNMGNTQTQVRTLSLLRV